MEGPVITVDVSKGNCHYQPFIENGHPMRKPKVLDDTIDGFSRISRLMEDLEKKTGATELPVVFEAAGVYHRPLQKYLQDKKIPYYIISPLLSAAYRKTTLNGNKTDSLDCTHIAKAYYSEELRPYYEQSPEYLRLMRLNRYYEGELVHLRKRKVALRSCLDIIYPRIDKKFSGNQNIYDPLPMEVLKQYPHPSLLLKHREDVIVKRISGPSGHKQGYAEKIVHKIYETAKECYSGCDPDGIEVIKLPEMIRKMQEQEQLCKHILSDITALAKEAPYYACVASIPGIGDNLASRIIAELGDINRFHNRSALVAYAGLNPKILQSGDIDGTHLKISKKGNKHLRCLLYIAASCNYRLKKYDSFYEFNKKKRQQFGSHKSKAATVATAHKLLVVIYAMCKNGSLYSF